MTDTPDDRRGDMLDRRRGTLEALEDHVNDHIQKIESRLAKWLFRGLIAYAIISIACAAALAGFGIVLDQIQETRKDFVRYSCEAQNKRNADTIAKFRRASDDSIKRNPEFADEIRQSRQANEEIINALAPKQNCDKLSKVAVGEEKPTVTRKEN